MPTESKPEILDGEPLLTAAEWDREDNTLVTTTRGDIRRLVDGEWGRAWARARKHFEGKAKVAAFANAEAEDIRASMVDARIHALETIVIGMARDLAAVTNNVSKPASDPAQSQVANEEQPS